jgi:hypothetical protein
MLYNQPKYFGLVFERKNIIEIKKNLERKTFSSRQRYLDKVYAYNISRKSRHGICIHTMQQEGVLMLPSGP